MYFDPMRLVWWAVAIVAVGLAINYAAKLLLAVWPVLAVVGALVALGVLLGRWWSWRGSGW